LEGLEKHDSDVYTVVRDDAAGACPPVLTRGWSLSAEAWEGGKRDDEKSISGQRDVKRRKCSAINKTTKIVPETASRHKGRARKPDVSQAFVQLANMGATLTPADLEVM